MKERYNALKIEKIVQDFWEKNKIFEVKEEKNKKKYYCLPMIPYPSGKLHMGHVRNYTISDVISRFHRMNGKNVLQPIGWDAFGLPAENAAIENNISPYYWVKKNIKYMKKQLKNLGFSYDWSREIITCDSKYYQWEQWIFIQLYKKGLIYRKNSFVNWCTNDLTVLANEQVIDGRCWRCNKKIIKKEIPQWFIKIRRYAEELLNDLDKLSGWPDEVKLMQKNWIGKSEGINIIFNLFKYKEKLIVYTTSPESLLGLDFISIKYNHPLVKKFFKKDEKINKFIQQSYNEEMLNLNKDTSSKKEILTDLKAINPINNEKVPIFITNFMLNKFQKKSEISFSLKNIYDWKLSKKYNLKNKILISYKNKQIDLNEGPFLGKEYFFITPKEYFGMNNKTVSKIILKKLIDLSIAKKKVCYLLQDWNVSRQRFWGSPIPVLIEKNGSYKLILDKKFFNEFFEKIKINKISDLFKKKLRKKSIFIKKKEFKGEFETFDTFMESSWYYARYANPNYKKRMIDIKSANYWLPVDQYIGGIEHATMHLLYFRFFHKLMRDIGLLNSNEPVKSLLCQGMVLGDSFYFYNKNGKKVWISYKDIIVKRDKNGKILSVFRKDGKKVFYAGMIKMSKSKKNGVNPEVIVKKYGADTLRLFIMFSSPPKCNIEWKESNIKGSNRFINRIWNMVFNHLENKKLKKKYTSSSKEEDKLMICLNETIDKVTLNIGKNYLFNVAIAYIMKLLNRLKEFQKLKDENLELTQKILNSIVLMLYPIIPHVCFILWKKLGNKDDIDTVSWPKIEKSFLRLKKTFLIQINGKVKDKLHLSKVYSKELLLKKIKERKKILKYLSGKKIKKIIYIKDKVINFII